MNTRNSNFVGKCKTLFSFLISIKGNLLFEETMPMYCVLYIKVKCVTAVAQRIGWEWRMEVYCLKFLKLYVNWYNFEGRLFS